MLFLSGILSKQNRKWKVTTGTLPGHDSLVFGKVELSNVNRLRGSVSPETQLLNGPRMASCAGGLVSSGCHCCKITCGNFGRQRQVRGSRELGSF